MAKQYNFDLTLTHERGAKIQIDTKALYGYFEFEDGTEGGGLWFGPFNACERKLELQDYDGVFELGNTFLNMLHTAGFSIEDAFYVYPRGRANIASEMHIENKTV
jgi:hypothetical protein